MKTKLFILALAFSAAAISCKKETAEAAKTEVPKEKQRFSVDLDISAQKDDNYALYYTEDNTSNFNGDHTVWSGVKGGDVAQTVTFGLKEEVIPTNIRIDFGIKQGAEKGDVTLQKMKLNFYGKTFEAKGSDFLKYFIKNDSIQTEIDPVKGTIIFKNNPKSKLTPFYYPQQALVDEIKKLTN